MFNTKKKSAPAPASANKGMNEELEIACFQIISHAGTARSQFILAIDAAEKGDFEEAAVGEVEELRHRRTDNVHN